MRVRLRIFLHSQAGASTTEYGLIAGGLATVVLGALRYMGTNLSTKMGTISNTLT
ncbi:MAG: Flp family type IVb pilin [Beijerinckiaceae bacterium]